MSYFSLGFLFLTLPPAIGRGGHAATPDWGYSGENGPANWASLSEDYRECGEGVQQSPIDLVDYSRDAGPRLEFDYGGGVVSVTNNGRQVSFTFDDDNELRIGQEAYTLQSAHLHAPSEHLIDGVSFAAELHLVHGDSDGNLAVIGVLFAPGSSNPMAQTLLEAAPKVGEEVTEGLNIDASLLTPTPGPYFHYAGSKTTPPCDEPVDWYVLTEPLPIGQSQVDALWEQHGGPNSRPIQPRQGREIRLVGA